MWKLRPSKDEMTVDEVESFCSSNPQLVWLNISGGEPFLRKDILGILEAVGQIRDLSLINVATNGLLTEEIVRTIREFLSRNKRDIRLLCGVSLEGVEALHDEVVGRQGAFSRATETLRGLAAIGDPRFLPGICYTISKFNEGHLEEFYLGSKGLPGLETFTITIANDAGLYNVDGEVASSKEMLGKDLDFALRAFPKRNLLSPMSLVRYRFLQLARDGRKPVECIGGKFNVVIDPYWNAFPSMFHIPDYPVGNLRKEGFQLDKLDGGQKSEVRIYWTPCEAYAVALFKPWRLL